MAKVGNVFKYGETVCLVKEVKANGGVVAVACAMSPTDPDIMIPVPNMTLHLSKDTLSNCVLLGEMEAV